MGYRMVAWTTVRAMHAWDRMTEERGQGTVEYVGIVVMVALLVSGVGLVAGKWGGDIGDNLKDGLIKAIKKLVGQLVAT